MKKFDKCATTEVIVEHPVVEVLMDFTVPYDIKKITATINYYTSSLQDGNDLRDVDIQCVNLCCYNKDGEEIALIPSLWQSIDIELKDAVYQNFSFETLQSISTITLNAEHTLYKDMDRWPKSPLQNLSLALQQLGFSDDSIQAIQEGHVDSEIKSFIKKNSLSTERALG